VNAIIDVANAGGADLDRISSPLHVGGADVAVNIDLVPTICP
jgi:hypothetical protein